MSTAGIHKMKIKKMRVKICGVEGAKKTVSIDNSGLILKIVESYFVIYFVFIMKTQCFLKHGCHKVNFLFYLKEIIYQNTSYFMVSLQI